MELNYISTFKAVYIGNENEVKRLEVLGLSPKSVTKITQFNLFEYLTETLKNFNTVDPTPDPEDPEEETVQLPEDNITEFDYKIDYIEDTIVLKTNFNFDLNYSIIKDFTISKCPFNIVITLEKNCLDNKEVLFVKDLEPKIIYFKDGKAVTPTLQTPKDVFNKFN